MTQAKSLTRRSFMQSFLSGLGGSSIVALSGMPLDMHMASVGKRSKLDFATFAGKLNSQFRAFYTSHSNVKMTLIAVTDLRAAESRAEVFSLLFETSAAHVFEQGTYTFKQAQLGKFSMFIVPASSDGVTHRYEALFNRMESA
jgi:hypothetical protein